MEKHPAKSLFHTIPWEEADQMELPFYQCKIRELGWPDVSLKRSEVMKTREGHGIFPENIYEVASGLQYLGGK